MIGSDSVPSGLVHDRVWRSGGSESWREPWDDSDEIISSVFEDLERSQPGTPIAIHSFRSNLSEISIIREESGWAIGWDERFFDHLLLHLLLLKEPTELAVRRKLATLITLHVGETYAVGDPHYAKILLDESAAFSTYGRHGDLEISKRFFDTTRCCFRIIRAFVLFHEWAHIAVKQPAVRDRERENLESATKSAREAALHPNRGQLMNKGFREDWHADRLGALVLELSSDDGVNEEMLADACALNAVIQMELALFNSEEPKKTDEHVAWVFSLIYEAIVLLHFFMATMNGAHEILRPKSIHHNFTIDQFRSIPALTARADIRGHLWKLLMCHHFNYDPNKILLIAKMKIGLREHYSKTLLNSWKFFYAEFNRDHPLSNSYRLRSVISEARARADVMADCGFSFWAQRSAASGP